MNELYTRNQSQMLIRSIPKPRQGQLLQLVEVFTGIAAKLSIKPCLAG